MLASLMLVAQLAGSTSSATNIEADNGADSQGPLFGSKDGAVSISPPTKEIHLPLTRNYYRTRLPGNMGPHAEGGIMVRQGSLLRTRGLSCALTIMVALVTGCAGFDPSGLIQVNVNSQSSAPTGKPPTGKGTSEVADEPAKVPGNAPAQSGDYTTDWQLIGSNYNQLEWRMTALKFTAKGTVAFLEIRNNSESDDSFFDFKSSPLAIIDAAGDYYKQTSSSDPPENLRHNDGHWWLESGRLIRAKVTFQAMPSNRRSGKIRRANSSRVQPFVFGQ
ncbi:hypothetical protein [Polyangium sorediatum]|uniref:Lipoprotein n=1 Tax=Polyangium sorediatum TaxID=889274 RepID=A0ABT6P3F6_9BACT|nr:hypothetical protein [Polyangium sorediatum]MDI1435135.1 hypothetical protein [Polyangium sorediatum]